MLPAGGSKDRVVIWQSFVVSLALIPLEDIVGTTEQPNVPGTINEHPNWRHRFDLPAEKLLARPDAARRLGNLRERRS